MANELPTVLCIIGAVFLSSIDGATDDNYFISFCLLVMGFFLPIAGD